MTGRVYAITGAFGALGSAVARAAAAKGARLALIELAAVASEEARAVTGALLPVTGKV